MLSLLFIIFASIVLLLAFYEIRTRKWLATAICIEDPTQHIPFQSPLVFWAKFIKRFVLTNDTQNNSVQEDIAITEYKKRGYKAFQQVFLWFRFVRIWDPEQIKRILQTERSTFPKASGFMEGTDFGRLTGKSILFAEGDVWKKQKQSLGGAFHFEKLKLLQERVMVDRAQALIRIWEPLAGSVIEVHPWLTKLTLEVIGLAGFGHDFGALEGRHSKEVEAYNTILNAVMNPLRNIPGYKSLPIKDNRVVREAFELFEKLILDVIAQKREQLKNSESQQPNDLLDMLIAAREKDAMTEHELMQNVEVFFLAGHETSSGALAMTLHCLAEHPEIQEKLRQEVDRVLSLPSSVPDHNSIKEMRYLNCVINEVLRLYPPAASLVRVVEEDTELCGYLIHKGDMVAIPTYSVHRMKEYWGEDALEFRPERFLAKNEDGHQIDPHESVAGDSDSSSSSSSSAAHERHPYAYIPFGAGPRVCVGNNFALLEIKTVLSLLLRRFTFRTAPGSPVPFELARSITLKPRDDSRLIFDLRQKN